MSPIPTPGTLEALRGLSKAEAGQMWFLPTSESLKTAKGSDKETTQERV